MKFENSNSVDRSYCSEELRIEDQHLLPVPGPLVSKNESDDEVIYFLPELALAAVIAKMQEEDPTSDKKSPPNYKISVELGGNVTLDDRQNFQGGTDIQWWTPDKKNKVRFDLFAAYQKKEVLNARAESDTDIRSRLAFDRNTSEHFGWYISGSLAQNTEQKIQLEAQANIGVFVETEDWLDPGDYWRLGFSLGSRLEDREGGGSTANRIYEFIFNHGTDWGNVIPGVYSESEIAYSNTFSTTSHEYDAFDDARVRGRIELGCKLTPTWVMKVNYRPEFLESPPAGANNWRHTFFLSLACKLGAPE